MSKMGSGAGKAPFRMSQNSVLVIVDFIYGGSLPAWRRSPLLMMMISGAGLGAFFISSSRPDSRRSFAFRVEHQVVLSRFSLSIKSQLLLQCLLTYNNRMREGEDFNFVHALSRNYVSLSTKFISTTEICKLRSLKVYCSAPLRSGVRTWKTQKRRSWS